MIPTALCDKTQADNQEKRQGKGGKETEMVWAWDNVIRSRIDILPSPGNMQW
jgi:hypothetical protein